MLHDEKLKKVCSDFLLLNEEQQDYILGILQALVFAKSSYNQHESDTTVSASTPDNAPCG